MAEKCRSLKRISPFFPHLCRWRGGRVGILVLVLVFAFLVIIGCLLLLYNDARNKAQRLIENPQEAAVVAFRETVDKVGKLMVLPEDEDPTLATVTDVEKLKTQAFFAKAQNGDKVLIYTKNRLAVLYRPGENKLVAVGTVNLNTQGQ